MKKRNTTYFLMLIILFGSQLVFSNNIYFDPPTKKSTTIVAPTITATGNAIYCISSETKIVNNVHLTDPDNLITEIYIQISAGYVNGQDKLIYSGSNPAIGSDIFDANTGKLRIYSIGTTTLTDFENAIKEVKYSNSSTTPSSGTRNFSITIGQANYLPRNKHFYRYISRPGIRWTEAKAEAESSANYYYGLKGYLATLTASDEAQLAGKQASGAGWIGGSDNETEGVWKWVTGPEAGTIMTYTNWNSGEPNDYGNGVGSENYAHITTPGMINGIKGSWNDLPDTGDTNPTSAYYPLGYIVEYGGMVSGDVDSIQISASTTLSIGGQITTTTPGSNCGSGSVTLSATASHGTIEWYSSDTGGTPVATGNIFTTPNLTTTTNYYVSPTGCPTNRSLVTATINPLPVVQNTAITQCDTDLISDGKTTFNLTINNSLISSNYANETFKYYTSLNGATNDIATDLITNELAFQNTIPTSMDIWTRVNNSFGCHSVSKITLKVPTTNFNPSSNYPFTVCDDFLDVNGNNTATNSDTDGIASFDFSSTRTAILSQLPTTQTYTINYYRTQADALSQLNAITDISNYRNIGYPNAQNIWVRIETDLDNSCVGLGPYISLNVEKLPNIELNSTNLICSNIPTFFVTLDAGFLDNSSVENFNYNWKIDGNDLSTTPTLGVNTEGNYTVEVTNQAGCSRTRTIQVTASNSATINAIDIVDLVDINTVTINASGLGDYEYSMDYLNGVWQDYNFFSNVPGGVHQVFVNDKNGCGVVSKEITVLSIPKFFTPNNDSYNDFWIVKGMESYPKSELRIFDRYGKLLKELTPNSLGWDGTFNGYELPASDYWFVLKMDTTAPEKRGHFTLKR